MHASMKISQGKSAACNYCPLDLYSGDEVRVQRALKAIWENWLTSSGTINNLRIFIGGTVVDPSDVKLHFAALII